MGTGDPERVGNGLHQEPSLGSKIARDFPTPELPITSGTTFTAPKVEDSNFTETGHFNFAATNDAQGVYLELAGGAQPVEVTVLSVDGETLAVAYLSEEDRFYFEALRISSVVFSSQPSLLGTVRYLPAKPDYNLDVVRIATVDARVFVRETLQDTARRAARSDDSALVTIVDEIWDAVRQSGQNVINAHDMAQPLGDETTALNAAAGLQWEIAALIGWVFIDGEHSLTNGYDDIIHDEMLKKPSESVFAYQIVAHFSDGTTDLRSAPYFVRATPLPVLSAPVIRTVEYPRVKLESVSEGPISCDLTVAYPEPEDLGFKPLDTEALAGQLQRLR